MFATELMFAALPATELTFAMSPATVVMFALFACSSSYVAEIPASVFILVTF